MIPMIYSNIRCKVKKISTGSPVKLSCNIHRYTLLKYEVLCLIQTFFFISSNFNYFVKSKVAQIEKKTYYLVLVFEILELFCWTISSDFWRVHYIYLNYLLMDPEYYQKSSYLLQIACAWWLCLLER